MKQKIDLYILSLGILFILFFILTIPVCYNNCKFVGYVFLLKHPILLISVLLLIYSYYVFNKFVFDFQDGGSSIPFKIEKIENINYEYSIFLSTYIIPLLAFDVNKIRHLIIVILLLIIIGIISIKANIYYANPSLALLGFHIYKVDGKFKNNNFEKDIILISHSRLNLSERVTYIELDNNIYYAKKIEEK